MGKTPIDLLIFDLDGTLIESKWDIAASVNLALEELGLPQRPEEEIFGFVGDGVKKLPSPGGGRTQPGQFRGGAHGLSPALSRPLFGPDDLLTGRRKSAQHFSD